MTEHSRVEESRFAWIATAAFVLLTVPRLLLHELWRDEAWVWQVVIESDSIADLFQSLGRAGHGYLFPLLCYLARQVSASPLAMQLLHLLLAGAAAFVFARYAPFGRLERALFVLGYFPFYEYAVISRIYVAGLLLLWLGCAAARSRRPALALGAVIGLLCQTSVYGYMLALVLAAGWLLRREPRSLPWSEAAGGLALALAGAVAGLLQLVPMPGSTYAGGWRFGWDPAAAKTVLMLPWRAFVPLPRFGLNFWGTNLLDFQTTLQAAAGLLTLALAAAFLWRAKVALVTFCLGAAGLLAFSYIKFIGSLRHHGHFWLLFAVALWLGGGLQEDRRSWRARLLLALLIVHCGAAAYASWMDLRHPFSNGAATAELIRAEGLDRYPLFGHREPPAATVAFYLGQPLYFPSRKVFATHPEWGPEERELSDEEVRCAARELARREGEDIVLVINRQLPPWEELEAVGSRVGAIVATEDYHLYRLRHGRLQSAHDPCPDRPLAGSVP